MRLLLLSSEFPPGPGGIGTHAYQLTRNLAQCGWKITVITSQDYASEEEIATFNKEQCFQIVRLPSASKRLSMACYRWRVGSMYIRNWQPDALLGTGSRSVWLSAIFAYRYNLPFVAVGHGSEFGFVNDLERKLTQIAFQRAASVVCVSKYTMNQMHVAGIKPQVEKVIPNGADATCFRVLNGREIADFRSTFSIQGRRFLITVGNVTERKGQDVVIRAMPFILQEEPETHYLIVGLPTKEREYRRLSEELGVADHVHFLGKVDTARLVQLLNMSDIFLMTSRHTHEGDFEGYGIAVLEAALCGKPAIVSVNSGLAETILDGVTGIGVREDDELAVAQAALSLLKDQNRLLEMGGNALKRVLQEQTWEHRVNEYDELLRYLTRKTEKVFYKRKESQS